MSPCGDRPRLQSLASPAAVGAPPTSADLWAELPHEFQRCVFVVDEEPFSSVIYNYDYITSRTIDCSGLPLAMQRELAWWLYSLFECGELVSPIALTIWRHLIPGINAARNGRGEQTAESFLDLSFDTWMAGARRSYYDRYGKLPGPSFARNYEHILRRVLAALRIRYSTVEWWRQDVWDPKHDRRIPLGKHEALGSSRIDFAVIPQPWLRDAMRWFLAVELERGRYRWSSIMGFRTHLRHFSRFLAGEGIDTPSLCTEPSELRGVALRYLAFIRQARSPRAHTPLSPRTIGGLQATVAQLYAFMLDHKQEAAALLGEPGWLELSDAYGRLWRDSELRHVRRREKPADHIEPAPLSEIVEHLDILGMPTTQTKPVLIDGERTEVAGIGDPQAMRAYLLAVLTGRRINEILMMDFDPIESVPGIAGEPAVDEDAMVARLRYQQTKIEGAQSTILVEQAVVNIVHEQQRWLLEHGMRQLAGISRARSDGGPLAPGAKPAYLFLMMQRNRLGLRPYSRTTLGMRLTSLSRILRIRDSQGHLVDFQRTHRLRHTKATELLNAGVPVHVVQRYLGHRSPEMTMRYAHTLAKTHEREFLRLTKINRDGRQLDLDPRDIYEMVQLDKRTDRILPNGLCLLPPRQVCNRGNACLTCDQFATDASYLPEHEQQLGKLVDLIEQRQTLFEQRTGQPMSEENVWLEVRRREQRVLDQIITTLTSPELSESAHSVRGAGIAARLPDPANGTPGT